MKAYEVTDRLYRKRIKSLDKNIVKVSSIIKTKAKSFYYERKI